MPRAAFRYRPFYMQKISKVQSFYFWSVDPAEAVCVWRTDKVPEITEP